MKFSIITPSFNQLDWLRLCIASVKDQSSEFDSCEDRPAPQVQHIIQDAGSDEIHTIADEAGVKLHRGNGSRDGLATSHNQDDASLLIFSQTDEGMYDAINRGLRRAGGDVCGYLNSDEQYLPGTLRRVADAFARWPEIDVIFGDVIVVGPEGEALSYRRVILPDRIQIRRHLNTPSCGTFFRRSIVERGLLFDPSWKVIGDAAWIDSLLAAGVAMKTIQEPLAVFAMTGANLSGNQRAKEELIRWRSTVPLEWWRRLTATMLFRTRKLAAGAYRKRGITYSIYTPSSPLKRQLISGTVGAKWPE